MKQLYECDPQKNTKCKKSGCYIFDGPCQLTSCIEFAKLDQDGKPVKSEEGENDILDKKDKYLQVRISKDDTLLKEDFDILSPRERKVLRMRFGEGKTLAEIACQLHVTRERALQIESRALRKLKEEVSKK